MTVNNNNAVEQAGVISEIKSLLSLLDIPTLKTLAKEMADKQSFQQSAMVFHPSPHTVLEQLEYEASKLDLLRSLIKAGEAVNQVMEKSLKYESAKSSSASIGKLFGL